MTANATTPPPSGVPSESPGAATHPVPPHEKKGFGIDFLDPLFAIAIHIGFAEGLLKHAEWLHPWHKPTGHQLYDFFVFWLGFVTLMLSWIGYHQSIKSKPLLIRAFTILKIKISIRFWLDVLCVMCYAAMMIFFESITFVLCVLTLIFFLYVIWDYFKIRENPDHRSWGKREYVSVTFFVLFAILTAIHLIVVLSGDTETLAMCGLVFAYIFVFAYRAAKDLMGPQHPLPRRVRVYVAGPLSQGERRTNVERAIHAGRELVTRGFAPLIPHLTDYVDPNDDLGHSNWVDIGVAWVENADAVLRLPGPSVGADREVARAKELGIPVFDSIEALVDATR